MFSFTNLESALSGLFPIDSHVANWLRGRASSAAVLQTDPVAAVNSRFIHEAIEALLNNKLEADKGAKYAKELYLNLSTISPTISGPNSVKVATPLAELEAQNIKVDKAYLVSCTNSRASDIAAAAKVSPAMRANSHVLTRIGIQRRRSGKWRQNSEDRRWGTGMFSILGCDGQCRRVRCISPQQACSNSMLLRVRTTGKL